MKLTVTVFAAAALFIILVDAVDGIIAGQYATDGQFPYSVVILREGQVLCGGVLVTSQHVFTACHCIGQFGKIEDVTDIDWEPLETAYTINVTLNHSLLPTEPTRVLSSDDHKLRKYGSIPEYSDGMDEMKERSNLVEKNNFHQPLSSKIDSRDQTNSITPWEDDRTKREIIEFGHGQVRSPMSSFQHPSCRNDTFPWVFDYGVYQSENFYLNDFLEPMKLWYYDRYIMRKRFNELIDRGALCLTVGWGATLKYSFESPMNNLSEKLKFTWVKLVADPLCNELLCRLPYRLCLGKNYPWSDQGIVCATHVSDGDSCAGDDGNALICDDYVVGFANSGMDCMKSVPRFYTRLDYATDFYHSTVFSKSQRVRLDFVLFSVILTIKKLFI